MAFQPVQNVVVDTEVEYESEYGPCKAIFKGAGNRCPVRGRLAKLLIYLPNTEKDVLLRTSIPYDMKRSSGSWHFKTDPVPAPKPVNPTLQVRHLTVADLEKEIERRKAELLMPPDEEMAEELPPIAPQKVAAPMKHAKYAMVKRGGVGRPRRVLFENVKESDIIVGEKD